MTRGPGGRCNGRKACTPLAAFYFEAEGNIEFVFTRDLLTYSENGKVLRVWKRIEQVKQS